MIAWVNGIMVEGTPEEIERYRGLSGNKYFNTTTDNDIPEHVKNYKSGTVFSNERETKDGPRAWF